MRLGAILSPASDLLNTDQLKNQATDLEKSGFESLWAVQAIGRGFTVTDPLITLAVAATVTKIELGTAILQLPLYEPMDLAHRVYSVMQLAQNRFVLGLGTGSTKSAPTGSVTCPSSMKFVSAIKLESRTSMRIFEFTCIVTFTSVKLPSR